VLYPSLSRATEGFLLHLSAAGRSLNTVRNYKIALQRFTDHFDDSSIDNIESGDIDAYVSWLKNDFRITHIMTTKIPPRKLSKKSLSNTQGVLNVFWKWVATEFEIPNPFKVPRIKYYAKPISPLKKHEIGLLLDACDYVNVKPKNRKPYKAIRRTKKRDKAILFTFLDTGMRVSELCGIQIGDLLLDSGRIMITGKGSKTRFVYLGKISLRAVWSYLLERYPNTAPSKNDPLFIDQHGLYPMNRHSVYKLVKRLGKAAGVDDVYPHKFRHTFAVQFLRNGGNVFELQQLLGHSDLEMSRKYVQLAQMDLEVSAKRASPADCWRLR
jgi:integrase/recombinase XerD